MSEDILSLSAPPADARLPYGDDPNQFLDLRLPRSSESCPLLINIHGGFWRAKYDLNHAGHLCAALSARNLATANLEYRRVGNEGGGWPGSLADIRLALHYLQQHAAQHKLDLSRVIAMGHSAGGQLALSLARHEPSIRTVISLAGLVDLQRTFDLHLSNDAVVEFLRGSPSQIPDHYREADPMRLSISRNTTQWLIHGTADDVVPVEFSRRYSEKKKKNGENVQLLEISGADHFDVIDPRSAAWTKIEQVILQSVRSTAIRAGSRDVSQHKR